MMTEKQNPGFYLIFLIVIIANTILPVLLFLEMFRL